MDQKLRILIIDDDDPKGCVESVGTSLIQCLKNSNYVYDLGGTFSEAESFLQSAEKNYDLILLDLRLDGKYEWGGSMLLDKYWQRIHAAGSKVILYSGKPDAVKAYEWFNSGKGPFLFYKKAGKVDVGADFKLKIISLLRDRVRSLCQRASLKSALALIQNQSDSASIEGKLWSVDSLIAPWLYKLPGESERSKEAVKRILFPSDDLVRVFSYWFKGRAFDWPASEMYGLTGLAEYHLDDPSGAMDALTHCPIVEPKYNEAAEAARRDLTSLVSGLHHSVEKSLYDYISVAAGWRDERDYMPNLAAELVRTFTFELEDVEKAFYEGSRGMVVSRRVEWLGDARELFSGVPLYSPPYKDTRRNGITYAAARLAQAMDEIVLKSGADSWSVYIDKDEINSHKTGSGLPYVLFAICHAGLLFKSAAEIEKTFASNRSGHSLHDACAALRGYANWYVLSGQEDLHVWECPTDLGALDEETAISLWKRFNGQGNYRVIHILRIGVPLPKSWGLQV